MLNHIKNLFDAKELLRGNFGIEREGLRCDIEGRLVYSPHPHIFGGKLCNPYITTDFSESQMELITPTFQTLEEVYKFLNALYDIAAIEIGEEYLWPQSMPCIIPEDKKIPIAEFCECPLGQDASEYRKKLLKKYGGKKQLLSGIHYNFSFEESFTEKLYNNSDRKKQYLLFKNDIYLKIARNYLRYRWLLIYLLGGTSVVHESYVKECINPLSEVVEDSFSNEGALSYRNSECGYTNKVELFPNYNSVEAYSTSLEQFIEEGFIESPKELYSQMRLKAKDNNDFINSLRQEGINYLEYRSIDINPFDKAGISLEDLYFVQLFNLFLLIQDEGDYEKWQEEALENQRNIARYGQKEIMLKREGLAIKKEEWGLEILQSMKAMSLELGLGKEDILDHMIDKIRNYTLTYAYQIVEKVKKEGYIQAHLSLAKAYKQDAYKNRFKLEGYEDLELSTQLLMKEAIKRGIKIEIIDRSENFIALKQGEKIEYVKQATKTSKDNYVTVLMMENKTVTKQILALNQIKVPKGEAFNTLEQAIDSLEYFANKPIVIKPKSTNFGIGISIFPKGGTVEDMRKAFDIAFKHDHTVLVEEFVSGKEYRFLVIKDEVVGILHRVPANVKGDGIHSISQLLEVKNQDPLRGEGYKTPLEKINLDESARLFLKQQKMDFNTIPSVGKVVYLRENSNISTGGDSIDYTDDIPLHFKQIAAKAAHAIGAHICGVDMMIEDCSDKDSTYAIIELNFNPAIHIHCYPYKGKERNIAEKVLAVLGFIKEENTKCKS